MNKTKNEKLTPNAKTLRKNMTKEERRLWYDFLKGLSITVNRQKVIGDYIVDFICKDIKLIIEIDGGQHNTPEGIEYDNKRNQYLKNKGYKVLRFWNHVIDNNLQGVYEIILKHLN